MVMIKMLYNSIKYFIYFVSKVAAIVEMIIMLQSMYIWALKS